MAHEAGRYDARLRLRDAPTLSPIFSSADPNLKHRAIYLRDSMQEQLITALVGFFAAKQGGELLTNIYGDLAKPAMKQVGEAIGHIVGLGNTALWPVQLLNGRARISIADHMEKYRRKLENIELDTIKPIEAEIGVPILEKLSYFQAGESADLVIELLVSASQKAKCGFVHPAFINIAVNFTHDELQLLKALHRERFIPMIRLSHENHKQKRLSNAVTIDTEMNLLFYEQENILAYIENLTRLGLIECIDQATDFADRYLQMTEGRRQADLEHIPPGYAQVYERKTLCLGSFGRLFLKATEGFFNQP